MSNDLVMRIKIQGFEEPLFLVDKLGILEKQLEDQLQFEGRKGAVHLSTCPE